ncbi:MULTISPECIES: TlyA family RNA methyltransferase [Allobacillus]|uniref:TlyA family RNA methyltransferase n=1 Tax=Allobacillus salarius TaxID=1955272 RepID=A0A556PTE0_9BACI|nr:TlyA family RNA methyltransferase [Allobacillus salarius]TSJ67655.1 TlyA family RNA methyltransferase [Allobacillus salarius]
MKKVRLDVLLVEKGYFETREKAKRSIMAGLVHSESEILDKPGVKIDPNTKLTVKGKAVPYVSRGGLKLEKALKEFDVDITDKLVMDIGSSTGGFTDCALSFGAKEVYAIDVGYNQLAWKMRSDERVHVMERMNFRYVTPEDLKYGRPNFVVTDVSFISLRLIFPTIKKLVQDDTDIIALIKPQFEAGKEEVGKKGIVRNPKTHEKVIRELTEFIVSEGFQAVDLSYSPITGGDGNIEYLIHARWSSTGNIDHVSEKINEVISSAHESF